MIGISQKFRRKTFGIVCLQTVSIHLSLPPVINFLSLQKRLFCIRIKAFKEPGCLGATPLLLKMKQTTYSSLFASHFMRRQQS